MKIITILGSLLAVTFGSSIYAQEFPIVELKTNMGNILVELRPDRAPRSVESFLYHTAEGFYDGTVFHRVIADFMIQGGGHDRALRNKESLLPRVPLESGNGLSNIRGTIAMARTSDLNSATTQFFINTVDNTQLDDMPNKPGYAVFGQVVGGLNIVDRISRLETFARRPFKGDVPRNTVVIEHATWINRSDSFQWSALQSIKLEKITPSSSSGSCFVASPDGIVVTANHVIDGHQTINVTLASGIVLPAKIVAISTSNDLAILSIEVTTSDYISLDSSSAIRSGDKVFTLGYPAVSILGTEPKFSEGSIASMSGLRGEASHMQTSLPIQPGSSGGPLVTQDGRVIGIILSTAAVEHFYQSVGSLPQGINWAIKADYAKLLMPKNSPLLKYPDRRSAIDAVRKAVCRIVAE